MAIVGFTKLEALFRKAASLDIDKSDAKAITDIVEKNWSIFSSPGSATPISTAGT